MNRKICSMKAFIFSFSFFFLSILSNIAQAAPLTDFQAYGTDTVAGYSSLLTTSRMYPYQDIVFIVKKPDGSEVRIPAKTDQNGVAKRDLYDYHTWISGKFFVSVQLKNSLSPGTATSFTVYPDQVSEEHSMLVANTTLLKADQNDKGYITVHVRDKYNNPLPGHEVKLVSSRTVDMVVPLRMESKTDQSGTITFSVASLEKGISIYSAFDSTANLVLSSRAKIAYLKSASFFDTSMAKKDYVSNVGGDWPEFIPIAEAAESGAVYSFEILNLPQSIQPNQNVSFSVSAKDQNNMKVENYTGTIHFSAEGANSNNVSLPEDYIFKAEDLGEHDFNLGLKFITEGTYTLVVTDLNNQAIKGKKVITVGSGGNVASQNGSQKITVTTPLAGTFSGNVQTISGNAPAGGKLKIFDNDQEIGSMQATAAGTYSFQTPPLSDGLHKLYVVLLDNVQAVQATSDTREIVIDTAPPKVDEIIITPLGSVKPGAVINVKISSEENISQAVIIFNADLIELSSAPNQPGIYSGSMQAPDKPGVYQIDVVLVDQLGNQTTYEKQASVTVKEDSGYVSPPVQPQPVPPSPQPSPGDVSSSANLPPTQVFGVVTYGSDQKITLVWESANDDTKVKNYRIYYGLDPAKLDKVVDTKDASTTWYIPGLKNGVEVYAAVAAVDEKGLESINKSEVVSGIPFKLEVNTSLPDKPTTSLPEDIGNPLLHGASLEEDLPGEVNKSGSELLWFVFGSAGLSFITRKKILRLF